MKVVDKELLREQLETKIKLLNDTTWEWRATKRVVHDWLNQFQEGMDLNNDEQVHALFLLSNFLYFGQPEIRALLRSLYRDLIRSPVLQQIRRENGDTLDINRICSDFETRLSRIRFLSLGNPSESSTHLLYYFRQENSLPRGLFINSFEIFTQTVSPGGIGVSLRTAEVDRYVFVDDLCGSGAQAKQYARDIVQQIRALSSKASMEYYVLFGTKEGLEAVKALGAFDTVEAVMELDVSFKVLDTESRLFQGDDVVLDRARVRATCLKYGRKLNPKHPLGYKCGQLLLGFNHNTPDNTLPIFWGGEEWEDGPWKSIFKRYDKVYQP